MSLQESASLSQWVERGLFLPSDTSFTSGLHSAVSDVSVRSWDWESIFDIFNVIALSIYKTQLNFQGSECELGVKLAVNFLCNHINVMYMF